MFSCRPIGVALTLACYATVALAQNTRFPPATPESQGVPAAAVEQIAGLVESFVDKDYAVGSELLIIKNRRTIFHQAYGWADREDKRPWEIGAICNIRSMTKPLTGAAAQILIDRGKLGLDDPVANHLPGFDNDRSRAITVRQVLTHRSGLPLTILEAVDDYPDLIAQANAAGERGPQFEPGSKFWYSDIGTDVVGAIVEVVSGEKLDTFVEREIFEPLGMTDTFYGLDNTDSRFQRIVSLYGGAAAAWTRFWTSTDDPFYPFAWGSQTVYSTPQDYARFLAMWMDGGMGPQGRVLSQEAVARMLEPISPMSMLGSDARFPTDFRGLGVYYGQLAVVYCSEDDPEAGPVILSHSGSDGTIAWAWPQQDLMALYFTQSRGGTTVLRIEEVIDEVLLHPGEEVVAEEVPDTLRPLLGTYIADFGSFEAEEFIVLVKDGKLALDIPSQMVFELVEPDEQGRWAFAIAPGQSLVSFEMGPDGKASLLKLHQGPEVFDVPRKGTAAANKLLKPVEIDPATLEAVVGKYYDAEADRIVEIFLDDEGALKVKAPPNLILQLRPARDRDMTWVLRLSPGISLSFQTDGAGAIVSMTRHIGDEQLVMQRRD